MKILVPLFLLGAVTGCVHSHSSHSNSSAGDIISWNTDEGVSRLAESQYKVDFFKLANHFEPQSNKVFCGPATATIILNALRVRTGKKLPKDTSVLSKRDMTYVKWSPFYERYTQNNVFSKSPKSKLQVLGKPSRSTKKAVWGFQIRQYAKLFQGHGVKTVLRVVDSKLKTSMIKEEIIRNMATANNYVAVNYSRKAVEQPGGGHISPLGAYHRGSDSVLIMDVTPNKADWVWVKLDRLIKAMATKDTIENRGYVLVGP